MKITKRQLRRIIKEEKAKLIRESITDHSPFEELILNAAADIAQKYEELMGEEFFDEDPAMFDGRSTRDEWVDQAVNASMHLEEALVDAINSAIQKNETELHDGAFFGGSPPPGYTPPTGG